MTATMQLRVRTGHLGKIQIDRAAGVLRDVSVIAIGEAKGHGFSVDRVMLQQVFDAISQRGSVPVRFVHPRGDADPLPMIVGQLRNVRLTASAVRGDIHLLATSEHRARILEIAETMPGEMGLSIESPADAYEIVSEGGRQLCRLRDVSAADLVGKPAANPRGLLNQKEGNEMDESKAVAEMLGLPADASLDDVLQAVSELQGDADNVPGDQPPSSGSKPAAMSAGDERARLVLEQKNIRGFAKGMHLSAEWAESQIDNGLTLEQAMKNGLDERKRLDAQNTPAGFSLHSNEPAPRDVLVALTLERMGRRDLAEKMSPGILHCAARQRVRSGQDLAAAALRLNAIQTDGRSDKEVMQLAFSTMNLPNAFGGAGERVAADAYAEIPNTWSAWAARRSVKDFRTTTSIRPYLKNSGFEEVGETGTIKHANGAEETYTYSARTFARMLTVSRQAIVNDEIGAIGEMFAELGRQGARAVADGVYAALLANTGDHFGVGNDNYLDGGTSSLSTSALTAAITKLRKTKDAGGRLIGLQPRVLLVAPEQEAAALQIIRSAEVSRDQASDNQATGNPWMGAAEVIVEPRLSDTDFHENASTLAWYLLAGPNVPVLVVALLEGRETPTVETADADFNTLGQSVRGFIDYGAALADYRGGILNVGA